MDKSELSLRVYVLEKTKAGFNKVTSAVKSWSRGVLSIGRKTASMFGSIFKGGLNAVSAGFRKLRNASLAIAAGIAFSVKEFASFNTQMARAATMMDIGSDGFAKMRKDIIAMSMELGVAKKELSEGLYQALSAGIPKENVLEFLKIAAKTAVADGSDVSIAVDGITTVLNAFKIPASEAERVADLLFQTVAKGKTNFAQLASSISVAAPVAAATGVKLEELLAAVATLTKQGKPTTIAMTEIRSSIVALNDVLGDGWTDTMSYQQALEALYKKAGGSQNKLKELVGRMEAVNAVIGLTGKNAEMAGEDIKAMTFSVGSLMKAFTKVDVTRRWPKLWQAILGTVTLIGGVFDRVIGPYVNKITERIKTWNNSTKFFENAEAKLKKMAEYAENIFRALAGGGETERVQFAHGLKDVVKGSFQVAVNAIGPTLLKIASLMGSLIAKAIKDAFKMGPSLAERDVAFKQLQEEGAMPLTTPKGRKLEGFESGYLTKGQEQLVDELVLLNRRNKELAKAGKELNAELPKAFALISEGLKTLEGVADAGKKLKEEGIPLPNVKELGTNLGKALKEIALPEGITKKDVQEKPIQLPKSGTKSADAINQEYMRISSLGKELQEKEKRASENAALEAERRINKPYKESDTPSTTIDKSNWTYEKFIEEQKKTNEKLDIINQNLGAK